MLTIFNYINDNRSYTPMIIYSNGNIINVPVKANDIIFNKDFPVDGYLLNKKAKSSNIKTIANLPYFKLNADNKKIIRFLSKYI